MEAAYERLDEATQERIDDMVAVHDFRGFFNSLIKRGASSEEIARYKEKYPEARHPVVRTHPVSGRKSLYVNAIFTQRLEGLEEQESCELLDRLCRQAWIPDVQCRFRWAEGSVAFWDNRAAQHYAVADYYPEVRSMERVTIIGDRPF